jgi:hypothetical protein
VHSLDGVGPELGPDLYHLNSPNLEYIKRMLPSVLLITTSVFATSLPKPGKCNASNEKALCALAEANIALACMACPAGTDLVGNDCEYLKCDVSTGCKNVVVPLGECKPMKCNAKNEKDLCAIDAIDIALKCLPKCPPGSELVGKSCETLKCGVSTGCKNVVLPLGECKPTSPVCPAVFAPVCGVDGKTYSNECELKAKKVKLDYKGECKTSPVVCPAVVAPVCGVDGKTYSNECELNAKNVKIQFKGECKCKCSGVPPIGCPAPQKCSKGYEWGGCPQLCDQATCKWKILNPGCVPVAPKVTPNPTKNGYTPKPTTAATYEKENVLASSAQCMHIAAFAYCLLLMV